MARMLDNFLEVGWKSDNGCMLRTYAMLNASISVSRKSTTDRFGEEHQEPGYKVTFILESPRTLQTIAIAEMEYTRVEQLMEALGIDDVDEIWEILE